MGSTKESIRELARPLMPVKGWVRSEINRAWFDGQRLLLFFIGLLYSLWHLVFVAFAPGASDSLGERLLLSLVCFVVWAAYARVGALRGRYREINLAILVLIMIHGLSLLQRNSYSIEHTLSFGVFVIPLLFSQSSFLHLLIFGALSSWAVLKIAHRVEAIPEFVLLGWIALLVSAAYILAVRLRIEADDIEGRREFEATVRQMPVGIVRYSTEGKVVSFSKRVSEILGPDRRVALGSPIDQSWALFDIERRPIPLAEYPAMEALIERREITGRVVGLNHSVGGREIWLQVNAAPIFGEQGQLEGVLVSFFDVTLQREMQFEVEHSRAIAEHTSRLTALGEMAGGIAHELNNPLAIVQGRVQQLESLLAENGWLNEKVVQILANIGGTADRMKRILSGLLSLARQGIKAEFESVSLKMIVDDTLALCAERIRTQGIDLVLGEIPAEASVPCRSVQLVQVLLNILNNARDAALENKDVLPPRIELSAALRDDGWAVRIQDSGMGVPDDLRSKLFRPFFTTKEEGRGTGLGLSVSRSIMDKHRGRIEMVSSHPTVFEVWIPLHRPPAQ